MKFSSAETPLFDIQVNGFAGVDFQKPDLTQASLEHACEELRKHRTGGILLTLITAPVPHLCRQMERIENWRQDSPLIDQMIAGYHLEGPYISSEDGYRGAHSIASTQDPFRSDVSSLIRASRGKLRLMTLAPERKGAIEAIEQLVDAGVSVSLGHTSASDFDIDRAISAGATLCTHLGNAVPDLLPRHDNVIQRLLAHDELTACFIPDGLHLPYPVLQNFLRAKPADKILFTSDCTAAAAAQPGHYTLGDLDFNVGSDGIARQPNSQAFAGSTLTMDQAVRNLTRHLGMSEEEAETLCGKRPRQLLGPDSHEQQATCTRSGSSDRGTDGHSTIQQTEEHLPA